MPALLPLLLVFLGGGLGALARFGVVALAKPRSPGFPAGTLIVNLSGCLIIGLVAGWLGVLGPAAASPTSAAPVASDDRWHLLLMVGVLGGYTTFSSFGLEVADLLRSDRLSAAAAYVLASNIGGIALTLAGLAVAARVRGA